MVTAACLAWRLPVTTKASLRLIVGRWVDRRDRSRGVDRQPHPLRARFRRGEAFVAALVAYAVAWMAMSMLLPRATTDPGALLPGAVLVGATLAGMQAVSQLYLPDKLGRASQLYGAIGTTIVTLGWFFFLGRAMILGMSLDAVIYEPAASRSLSSPYPWCGCCPGSRSGSAGSSISRSRRFEGQRRPPTREAGRRTALLGACSLRGTASAPPAAHVRGQRRKNFETARLEGLDEGEFWYRRLAQPDGPVQVAGVEFELGGCGMPVRTADVAGRGTRGTRCGPPYLEVESVMAPDCLGGRPGSGGATRSSRVGSRRRSRTRAARLSSRAVTRRLRISREAASRSRNRLKAPLVLLIPECCRKVVGLGVGRRRGDVGRRVVRASSGLLMREDSATPVRREPSPRTIRQPG